MFLLHSPHRLKASDLQLRFCTNETQATREKFVAKLQRLGFDICASEVFPPAPAAIAVLKERRLRPHLLVHDGNDLQKSMEYSSKHVLKKSLDDSSSALIRHLL